jgi:hypothetical protein
LLARRRSWSRKSTLSMASNKEEEMMTSHDKDSNNWSYDHASHFDWGGITVALLFCIGSVGSCFNKHQKEDIFASFIANSVQYSVVLFSPSFVCFSSFDIKVQHQQAARAWDMGFATNELNWIDGHEMFLAYGNIIFGLAGWHHIYILHLHA